MYWYYRASALAGVGARAAHSAAPATAGHIQIRIGVKGARNQRLTRPSRDMHGFIDASLEPYPANNLSFLCDKCPFAAEVRQALSLFQYGMSRNLRRWRTRV